MHGMYCVVWTTCSHFCYIPHKPQLFRCCSVHCVRGMGGWSHGELRQMLTDVGCGMGERREGHSKQSYMYFMLTACVACMVLFA